MRRVCFSLLLLSALLLAACGASTTAGGLDPAKRVEFDQFPTGTGRGFAKAQLVGEVGHNARMDAGQPAPDFALMLEDGSYTTLSALQGRPVVLNFWATWCGPCRMEMPELVAAAAADPELVVIAANVQETLGQVEPFATEFAMALPVMLDAEGSVRQAYQVQGLPTTFFIDRNGAIASVFMGPLTPAALAERLAAIE
jgi:cytochrome c biogenesis protein CcmG, thiol:disulfide interchange protein DsbE